MKKILLLIIILSIYSCDSKKEQNPLLGKWYSDDPVFELIEIEFKKDSIIQRYFRDNASALWDENANWKLNGNKIKLFNITGSNQGRENLVWIFKMNKEKDQLKIKIEGDTTDFPILLKAENTFDYLEKKYNLSIELPLSTKSLKAANQIDRFFKVYAGYNNDKLVVKTYKSDDLNNINSEVNDFVLATREEFRRYLNFTLIADKNIPTQQIDSIIKKLKSTSINYVYRVYKTPEIDYKDNLDWQGIKN